MHVLTACCLPPTATIGTTVDSESDSPGPKSHLHFISCRTLSMAFNQEFELEDFNGVLSAAWFSPSH